MITETAETAETADKQRKQQKKLTLLLRRFVSGLSACQCRQ
jgi:hypothetical protein